MSETGFDDAEALAAGLIAREPGALSSAVRLAGSAERLGRERVRAAIDAWLRRTGKSARIGLVGMPPAVVDPFARRLVERGHRVAVLQVGADAAGDGDGPRNGERGDRFDGPLPDETAIVAATFACEIGGFDTVLVSVPSFTDALAARVDCTVGVAGRDGTGDGGVGSVDVIAEPPSGDADDDALDALWLGIERYRWRAVEDGTHAARREAQRALW